MKIARIILLLITALGLTGCDPVKRWAEPNCDRWDNADTVNPFELLKISGCFRIGGVGVAAATPPEQIALGRLMEQKDASVTLEKLFSEGSPASQLYALLGLRFIDRAKYEELVTKVKQNTLEIETQGGCIISHETVQQIIKSIEAGNFDIHIQHPASQTP